VFALCQRRRCAALFDHLDLAAGHGAVLGYSG
jgi:hypothetical protein